MRHWMVSSRSAALALSFCLAAPLMAFGQAANDSSLPTLGAGTAAPAPATPPPGWNSVCQSISRAAPLECRIEQRAILAQTGQLIASITIRVPGDTRSPVLMVRVPLGLSLEGGVTLNVDGAGARSLPLQTCDNSGCYAGAPLPEDLLAAMRAGAKLEIAFQNLNKEPIKIAMSLVGFSDAFAKVK